MPEALPAVIRSTRLTHCGELVYALPPVERVPLFDANTWDLTLFPVPFVSAVMRLSWSELLALPRTKVLADTHSREGWTKRDNFWDGVATSEIIKLVKLHADVTHVMIHGEYGLSTNLHLEDFLAEDAILAFGLDGSPLAHAQGGPLRLVVPHLWWDKQLPHVRGIEFMTGNRPGSVLPADRGRIE